MTKQIGYFGRFGGRFAPETLMPELENVERAFVAFKKNADLKKRFQKLLKTYCGRETPLYFAESLTRKLGGSRIYLKREDLNHTGAHKITNALGQALLAVSMGKKRLVAETGAGQHGVATATAAALLGLECDIYMGTVDMARQRPNVFRMNLLGTRVIPVESGSKTLKDAVNEAIRDWSKTVRTTHYVFGSALGPHPFPTIVREFQSVIGKEARRQILTVEGRLPSEVVACVGGGSNAIGIFSAFLKDNRFRWSGLRPAVWDSKERSMRPVCRRPKPRDRASCTAPTRTSCRMITVRSPLLTRSPPGWITAASGPNTRVCANLAASSIPMRPMTRLSRPLPRSASVKGSSQRSNRHTRWPMPSNGRRK